MGVVQLNGDLFGQRFQSPLCCESGGRYRTWSRRSGNIPGRKRSSWPKRRRVVRVEHPGNGFSRQRFGNGADEIPVTELVEVKGVRRTGGPQPQCVDGLAAKPTTGRSKGTRIRSDGFPAPGTSCPPCKSNVQLSFTSTIWSSAPTSHGSGRRSQLSGSRLPAIRESPPGTCGIRSAAHIPSRGCPV